MKVLFLDIDGCLNYENYYKKDRDITTYPLSEICPIAIENLNRIVFETGCKVVISSTWRHSGINYCRNALNSRGFTGEIIDITPSLDRVGEWVERGNEIYKWLLDNRLYKYNSYCVTDHDYAIIDDDADMLYLQRHNFFQCSPVTGLTEEMTIEIINFLNDKTKTT